MAKGLLIYFLSLSNIVIKILSEFKPESAKIINLHLLGLNLKSYSIAYSSQVCINFLMTEHGVKSIKSSAQTNALE